MYIILPIPLKNNNLLNLVGLDDGKGLLKVVWNPVSKTNAEKCKFKSTGVKQSIVLGCAPVCESYINCKIILDKIDLSSVDFQISADLKLLNIILGLQSASSKFPCPYCLSSKNKDGKWIAGAESRTFQNVKENFEKFEKSDKKRKNLQKFFNVEFGSLINPTNLNTEILMICPPPPLHCIKLGPFNHAWESLNQLCPEVNDIIKSKLNVQKTSYQGKGFEGNQINKILRNIDSLKETLESRGLSDFLETFKHIENMDKALCSKKLDKNFKTVVSDFLKAWENLNIKYGVSYTNKIHIIESHVTEYVEKTGKPLGSTSDQLVEAMHSYVNASLHRSKYLLSVDNSENFGTKLYRGIMKINCYNLHD